MILSKPQLRELRQIIVGLTDRDTLRALVGDTGRTLEDYALGDNLDLTAAQLVSAANANEWIAELVEALRRQYPAHEELAALSKSLAPHLVAKSEDVFGATYIDRRPFIGRANLRRQLHSLASPDGARILVVNGARGTGKTWTIHLVRHVARQLGFGVVALDLVRYLDATPYDLASSINTLMGLPEPPPPASEQWSRWTLHYFNFLVARMRAHADAAPRQWWIVLDGFESISVPMAVHDFITELAARIDGELRDVRAVLLGYDQELPLRVDPVVVRDRTEPLTSDDLVRFFVEFYRSARPRLAASELADLVAGTVHMVLEKAERQPGPGNEAIGRQVSEVCRAILEDAR